MNKKYYIDYEWGVDNIISDGEGGYLSDNEILKLIKEDEVLFNDVKILNNLYQMQLNWKDPRGKVKLSKEYYNFFELIEKKIIREFEKLNIILLK